MNSTKQLPDLDIIKQQYIQEPYNTIVNVYFKKHFDEKEFNKHIDKFVSLLPEKAKVLDAGCGPGGETKKLINRGLNVIGIDISEKMLTKARQSVPKGNFRYMDLMKLNFSANEFDGIWSARSLIHIPTKYLKKTIAGFRKVLKPKGIMCLIVFVGKGQGIEPEYYDPTGRTKCFFKYFQRGELDKILIHLGFDILQSDSFTMERKVSCIIIFAKKN